MHPPQQVPEKYFPADQQWVHGIARHWAGFYLSSSCCLSAVYQLGKLVEFSDDSRRTITRIDKVNPFMNVYLEGEPLDPERVGQPSRFIVIDGHERKLR